MSMNNSPSRRHIKELVDSLEEMKELLKKLQTDGEGTDVEGEVIGS